MIVRTADAVYTCETIQHVYDGSGYFLDLWLTGPRSPDWYPLRIPVSAVLAIEVTHASA